MNEFSVKGIKCESCVAKIKSGLMAAGFKNASVTLTPPKIYLESDEPVSKDQAQKVLSKVGEYEIEPSPQEHPVSQTTETSDERLTPLFVILSYLIGGILLRSYLAEDYSFSFMMNNFMGSFLVIFSMFKLLNLSGFADAYATYDIIASRSRAYGVSYPFIELLLGIGYLVGYRPVLVNSATLVLMTIGSIGVYQALRSKRKFQCACLGTALKLPMTKVTLVEDVAMGAMALVMIFHHVM